VIPLLVALAALPAAGDSPPPAPANTYEERRVEEVLVAEGLERFTPRPRDRIEFIKIVRHEVFTEHDPFPDFLNWFHWTTVEEVVARELLFAEGDRFDARIEETGRNLRTRFIFSLARTLPVRRVDDGKVGVLVFTRDLWSLRAEQAFQITGLTVDRLLLQLKERNLIGRDKQLGLRFQMAPATFALGQVYIDRRVWGSRFSFEESADVVFNLARAAPEGGVAQARFGMPLQSLSQPWGFDITGSFEATPFRQLKGSVVLPWDDPLTPEEEAYGRVWDRRALSLRAEVTRQHGESFVQRLTVGAGLSDLFVTPNAESGVPLAQEPSFAAHAMPVPRRELFPFVAYKGFTSRFRTYRNLDSYGVSEVVRVGPAIAMEVRGGLLAAGSSMDFVALRGAAGHAGRWRGTLTEATVEASARWQRSRVVDRLVALRFRAATPHLLGVRAVTRLTTELRKNDLNHTLVTLGGDNGLRGYPSQAFFAYGASRLRWNLELRSIPFEWRSVQGGLAAFWDAGALFDDLDEIPRARHAVGVGIRFLFPQFNKLPYRLDLGVPLDGSGFMVVVSFGDTQAVEHAAPSTPLLDVRTAS
jgi:hypothetical protein